MGERYVHATKVRSRRQPRLTTGALLIRAGDQADPENRRARLRRTRRTRPGRSPGPRRAGGTRGSPAAAPRGCRTIVGIRPGSSLTKRVTVTAWTAIQGASEHAAPTTAHAAATTGRGRGRPARDAGIALSRGLIARKALDIAGSEGFPALTTHRLARALDVTPRALYNHVRDRQDVVDAVAALMMQEIPVPHLDPAHWRDSLRAACREARDAYRRFPRALLIVLDETLTPAGVDPNRVVLAERMLGFFVDIGLSPSGGGRAGRVHHRHLRVRARRRLPVRPQRGRRPGRRGAAGPGTVARVAARRAGAPVAARRRPAAANERRRVRRPRRHAYRGDRLHGRGPALTGPDRHGSSPRRSSCSLCRTS